MSLINFNDAEQLVRAKTYYMRIKRLLGGYSGRLSRCCNLSGLRGAVDEEDVIADLNEESFASAYERFMEEQVRKRGLPPLFGKRVTPPFLTCSNL